MDTFETILEKHPLDPYALHMAYFLALTTGAPQFTKQIPTFFRSHLQNEGHTKISCEALQALNSFLRECPRKTELWPE